MAAKAQSAAVRSTGAVVLLVCAAWGCTRAGARDLDGKPVDPFAQEAAATVLAFTSTECPISNRYAPELRRIAAAFAARGVRFWLIYPSRRDSVAKIRAHLSQFELRLPALLDGEHALVARAGAQVTPEVAVFRRNGELAYAGRIDDRYLAFGKARAEPGQRDLERALEAVLADRPVRPQRRPAIGCSIAE